MIGTFDRDDVGEAWVAYEWADRLSRCHDLTVLTVYRREQGHVSPQLPSARVIEFREAWTSRRWARLNSMLKPDYIPFYVRARRWIKQAMAAGETFDIAYQPVPTAMRYPSPVAGLGIPYVIGPVGGSIETPAAFGTEDTAPWFVGLRALDRARLRYDRLLRRTYIEAGCVLGSGPYVRGQLADIPLRRFEVMIDSGITEMPQLDDSPAAERPVRFLFVGRLVRTKGVRDAIRAMSRVPDLDVSLDIVGQGYDSDACAALIEELGQQDRITMHGQRSKEEVAAFYKRSDVFLFPSYREAGGIVVAEAMSYGLPLIVASVGGPAYTVDDTCGVKIDVTNPAQYARDLAAAIRLFATDPDLRGRLSAGARRRGSEIGLWENKVRRMNSIFDEVMAGH